MIVLAHKKKQTNRHLDQCNRINPHLYGQLTYGKGDKNMQWENGHLLNK